MSAEKFTQKRRVFFKDIMLTPKQALEELQSYKSDYLDLSEFDNKLYDDPVYSKELETSHIVYANFRGDWVIDSYSDDYDMQILKFTDNKSGQSFELAFPDAVNKMKFANELYSTEPLKQENSGLAVSDIASHNELKKKSSSLSVKSIVKAGIAIAAVASIFAIVKKMKK